MKLTASLVLASLMIVTLGLFIGPVALGVDEVFGALVGAGEPQAIAIVQEVRAPRVIMAWLVGAALGITGAALQGLLRNPLADAGVLGVSGFATLGAVLAFVTGAAAAWPLAPPVGALALAIVAALTVTVLGAAARNAATLALIGVGLSSFAGGLIALALNLAPNPAALADLVNWTLGSVEGRSFADVAIAAPFIAAGAALMLLAAPGLRALTLGEEAAGALGLRLNRTRVLVVLGTAAAAGGATAFVGIIGFVGVAAPHLIRPLVAHDPARLLLPSAFAGGAMLALADVIVRVLPGDTELKLGVAAALIGGPVFALIAARLASRGGAT